jgi:hypothetical protein
VILQLILMTPEQCNTFFSISLFTPTLGAYTFTLTNFWSAHPFVFSLGGDVAVNSGSTASVIDKDTKAGAAMFNIVDNLLVPADELASVSSEVGPVMTYRVRWRCARVQGLIQTLTPCILVMLQWHNGAMRAV